MRDSGDVGGAGLLLRQFDKNNDRTHPWLPCPRDGPDSWCGKIAGEACMHISIVSPACLARVSMILASSPLLLHSDRWSALLVNALSPHLYDNNGGLVLASTAKLFCAYPEDGDSSHESKVCYDT